MKTNFDAALWDGSDPNYAPCTTRGGARKDIIYWTVPQRYRKAGYSIKRINLGTSKQGVPIPTDIAVRARELTREMVQWYEDSAPKLTPGTWLHLIARYKSDEFSPIQSVKGNTREGYMHWLASIEAVLGHVPVEKTTYELLMKIRQGKEKKGRSVHHIHNWFGALRRVARYGVLVDHPGAARAAEILSNMRITTPPARQSAATRAHIEAIVAEADKEGLRTFAAGILIQWWFGLRAVDVRGIWIDGQWQDGLTWGHFNEDITAFEKVISKTRKSLPEAYHFDLTVVPGLRQRLLELRAWLHPHYLQPHMPLALSIAPGKPGRPRTGKAYSESGWTHTWARMREKAGVPSTVWCMDLRAGAITDAASIPGVSISQLRNMAQHKDAATTGRYIRDRSTDLNKIVQLRANPASR